jgi:hypothetical protein
MKTAMLKPLLQDLFLRVRQMFTKSNLANSRIPKGQQSSQSLGEDTICKIG